MLWLRGGVLVGAVFVVALGPGEVTAQEEPVPVIRDQPPSRDTRSGSDDANTCRCGSQSSGNCATQTAGLRACNDENDENESAGAEDATSG